MNQVYMFISLLFVIFSYSFVDGNLASTTPFRSILTLSYQYRWLSGSIFFGFIISFFGLYLALLKNAHHYSFEKIIKLLILTTSLLAFSYSCISYDVFNYIATAKVAYTYGENPYIIMPIDIPNEPNLAFTRAANKVALYGPIWVLVSYIPHSLGFGSIWATMILFKLFAVFWLWGSCFFLWKLTNSISTIVFFAFNPLVLIEIAVAGHNDIVMMTLFLIAIYVHKKVLSWIFFGLSILVKGATLVLLPLVKRFSYRLAFWIMLTIFFIFTPLREELYPWYAVWFLPFAAELYHRKYSFEPRFAIILSLALELRHIPYMIMGYYEGPGPQIRAMITIIPVLLYCGWYVWEKRKLY